MNKIFSVETCGGDQHGGKSLSKRFKLKKVKNWVILAVNQMKFITSDDEAAECGTNNVSKPKNRLKFRFIAVLLCSILLKMDDFVISGLMATKRKTFYV